MTMSISQVERSQGEMHLKLSTQSIIQTSQETEDEEASSQHTVENGRIEAMINETDFVRMSENNYEGVINQPLESAPPSSPPIEGSGEIPDCDTQDYTTPPISRESSGSPQVDSTGNTHDISGTNTPEVADARRGSSDGMELIEYHFLDDSTETGLGRDDNQSTLTLAIPAFSDFSPPPSVGNVPSMPATPPPTYAEAMKDAIPLSFIDFWPQCVNLNDENFLYSKFETFDRVLEAANSWLLEQRNIVIRNCETTELKASSLDEFIVLTATKTSTFKSSCRPMLNIKGLRVWYSSKIINQLPFVFAVAPFKIAYQNYKATLVNVGDHLEYEKFPSLLVKCNDDIKNGKINGRILNAETVYLKEPDVDEFKRGKMSFDADDTTWRDFYSKTALQVLRVYYIPELPMQEELKFHDFIPERSRRSRSHSKFRDFSTVMDDCRLWLVHLSCRYRLINAQTMEMKYISKEVGNMDSNATYFSDYEGYPRVRFLRIFYGTDVIDTGVDYGLPLLSHKTFIPAPLKRRRHETLAALMHRVETWLRATGATVVCAETLPMLEQVYQEKNGADFSLYRSEWMDASNEYDHETLLYVVRVYLDTVYPEPPPQIFLDGEDSDFDEECVLF